MKQSPFGRLVLLLFISLWLVSCEGDDPQLQPTDPPPIAATVVGETDVNVVEERPDNFFLVATDAPSRDGTFHKHQRVWLPGRL